MYFTAKSYENYERIGESFTKENKLYTKVKYKCDRCGGSGLIAARVENGRIIPIPVDNGVCYKCGGVGTLKKEVRLYTEKERNALDRAEEKRAKNRVKIEEERKRKRLAESDQFKKEWMKRNGFGEDGLTWCVFGDDTFSIKEELKEMGCKFSPILKWHSATPLNLPEGYGMISFAFDDIMEWSIEQNNAFFFEDSKEKIERKFREAEGPSLSEYVGEIGERLRNKTVVLKSIHGFSGRFGWTNIYTFMDGDNELVWFTAKELGLKKGDVLDLTGTIIAHEEFCGVYKTKINRCVIKKIG